MENFPRKIDLAAPDFRLPFESEPGLCLVLTPDDSMAVQPYDIRPPATEGGSGRLP